MGCIQSSDEVEREASYLTRVFLAPDGSDDTNQSGGGLATIEDDYFEPGGAHVTQAAAQQRQREQRFLELQLAFNESLAQERHRDLSEINRELAVIHELYALMAEHVQKQGVVLDLIEDHFNEVRETTAAAAEQIEQAAQHQQSWACLVL
eukprot:gnl/Spiro4/26872_TR13363_c0_g1_i1.p3 gnl/Spiro4/26872_TR13363_c0_g1~~gnl/Spiro4/26872_TR13363_c0_g1_i1.p3  ORF type:complete len:150 (-),score=43.20 gnl/Spiro4/26872_TR13363_c0_g1_i1:187-636(-)